MDHKGSIILLLCYTIFLCQATETDNHNPETRESQQIINSKPLVAALEEGRTFLPFSPIFVNLANLVTTPILALLVFLLGFKLFPDIYDQIARELFNKPLIDSNPFASEGGTGSSYATLDSLGRSSTRQLLDSSYGDSVPTFGIPDIKSNAALHQAPRANRLVLSSENEAHYGLQDASISNVGLQQHVPTVIPLPTSTIVPKVVLLSGGRGSILPSYPQGPRPITTSQPIKPVHSLPSKKPIYKRVHHRGGTIGLPGKFITVN